MATNGDIEARLAKLEAEADIKKLKIAYAGLCDKGYPAEPLTALFTVDGVFDGGDRFGVHRGHEALIAYFSAISSTLVWAVHYMVGPSITVDESLTTATGTWYLWEPCTLMVDAERVPAWITGKYTDKYRRVDGTWLFEHVELVCETVSDTRGSWVERAFVI